MPIINSNQLLQPSNLSNLQLSAFNYNQFLTLSAIIKYANNQKNELGELERELLIDNANISLDEFHELSVSVFTVIDLISMSTTNKSKSDEEKHQLQVKFQNDNFPSFTS
jgi:hypothetical protein